MSPAPDDWRRMGQESFLPPGTLFAFRSYTAYREGWDHDHCELCGMKLAETASQVPEQVLAAGFSTTGAHPRGAQYHWVCEPCFRDFASEFRWVEVSPA